jgi:hypothetical protein
MGSMKQEAGTGIQPESHSLNFLCTDDHFPDLPRSVGGAAMSNRERNYMEVLAHLEKARMVIGPVNPRFSYYERMVQQAFFDDGALAELQDRIQREGGLW